MEESDGDGTRGESKGAMRKRHLKEAKELKGKIAQLQHGCPKGDRAKRAEMEAEVRRLTAEMEGRQSREARAMEEAERDSEVQEQKKVVQEILEKQNSAQAVEKRERRTREVQARADRDRARAKREAREAPSNAEVEVRRVREKLRGVGCDVREVPADGDCLFAALGDAREMRERAVKFIREHEGEFSGFLDDEDEGEGGGDVSQYCERMSKPGCWGGHVELVALAKSLGRSVVVHSADDDDVVLCPEFSANPPIRIAFLKQALLAGEHYNAVVPLEEAKTLTN